MMVNPVVRARIRRLINVKSGLNDGIATPFVSVPLAGAATGGRCGEPLVPFVEETGALVSMLVWLAFGAVALVPALLALEELGSPAADRAVAIIVLLSVVAHGATAEPLAAWYAKLLAHRAGSGPGSEDPRGPDARGEALSRQPGNS